MPVRKAIDVAVQVADGLAAAHALVRAASTLVSMPGTPCIPGSSALPRRNAPLQLVFEV
jgi:hypothetical protein